MTVSLQMWRKRLIKCLKCPKDLIKFPLCKKHPKKLIKGAVRQRQAREKQLDHKYIDFRSGDTDFWINIEKKKDKGEDANPIVYKNDGCYVVATFDGMGGAGAAEYKAENSIHTGAYIASRIVRNVCFDYLKNSQKEAFDIKEISHKIAEELSAWIHKNNIEPSILRSPIIRTLPTTLAIIRASKKENGTQVTSYWCGDSRNYVLTAKGLCQVSVDHLSKPQDPLENLRHDESLSNCICQDRDFSIAHSDCGTYPEPIIILSATDGCFGYLKSPMHFEYLILHSLMESKSMDDWKRRIVEWLMCISGDDFSVGLIMIDGDYNYWKDIMNERYVLLKQKFIDPVENCVEDANRDKLITSLWNDYKVDFMH